MKRTSADETFKQHLILPHCTKSDTHSAWSRRLCKDSIQWTTGQDRQLNICACVIFQSLLNAASQRTPNQPRNVQYAGHRHAIMRFKSLICYLRYIFDFRDAGWIQDSSGKQSGPLKRSPIQFDSDYNSMKVK